MFLESMNEVNYEACHAFPVEGFERTSITESVGKQALKDKLLCLDYRPPLSLD